MWHKRLLGRNVIFGKKPLALQGKGTQSNHAALQCVAGGAGCHAGASPGGESEEGQRRGKGGSDAEHRGASPAPAALLGPGGRPGRQFFRCGPWLGQLGTGCVEELTSELPTGGRKCPLTPVVAVVREHRRSFFPLPVPTVVSCCPVLQGMSPRPPVTTQPAGSRPRVASHPSPKGEDGLREPQGVSRAGGGGRQHLRVKERVQGAGGGARLVPVSERRTPGLRNGNEWCIRLHGTCHFHEGKRHDTPSTKKRDKC